MEAPFLLLHRHDPYQMAQANAQCEAHLESIYESVLDILEQGISRGLLDGSVTVHSPRNTAMVLFAAIDGVVRFHTYRLYDAGALYHDLMTACRRMLKSAPGVT
jgi:hypothetical protein